LRTFSEEALHTVGQTPARHHLLLIEQLEAVARGEVDRLMVFMPPNSAKTTYASVLFPPWFMARARNQHIIGASHSSEYAQDLSGQILNQIRANAWVLGYGLKNEASSLWRTDNGCVYRAAGAGGSITGRRADLFLIDDPIKGRQDADSPTIRETVWNWYRAEVLTRLNPGARVILIQTRWHEDDLAGRLLQEQGAGADKWRVVNLPAVAEENDDMGRAPGEALWPERFPREALDRTRVGVGEREWASLYQQRPRPLEGALFKTNMIQVLPADPPGQGGEVRAWDLASTDAIGGRDPDWTAGVRLKKDVSGRYVVTDVVRQRGGPNAIEQTILNTASQDGKRVRIGLPQDPGQAGKAQVAWLTSKLAGYVVEASPETGSKETRAMPVASQVEVGNVAVVDGPWRRAFVEELGGFPSGTKDDQVDALSRAFTMIVAAPALRINPDALLRARRYA
jgi:predicted phage terminase large subunit-like protein